MPHGPADAPADPVRSPGPTTRVPAVRHGPDGSVDRVETLATEEPLEIRVDDRRVAVTMRTPGADFELAVGWLHAEGLLPAREALAGVRYCTDAELAPDERFNVVTVDLRDPAEGRRIAERRFVVTSACGVCGREVIGELRSRVPSLDASAGPWLDAPWLAGLPDRLRAAQPVFDRTGGLHAAGLFTAPGGDLVVVREDVGRHNAVDKVVGWALLEDRLPLSGTVLVVSGRASFEIVQKAVAAGIPALVAVSAPSSLAVTVARDLGLTLAAFARAGRLTVYAGAERVTPPG